MEEGGGKKKGKKGERGGRKENLDTDLTEVN